MKRAFYIILAFLLAGFLVPAQALANWQGPTGAPPSNNRPAPIDISATAQTKAGNLTLQGTTNFSGPVDFNQGFTVNNQPTINFGDALLIFSVADQQSALDVEANLTREQGLLSSVALINNSNAGQAAHSLYVSNAGDSQSVALYANHSGSGWAGYFQGPAGVSSYLVVGGAVQGGYSANGDLYLYGKAGIAGNLIVSGAVQGNFVAYNGSACAADQILKKSGANWTCQADNTGGAPGGANTQVQFNAFGTFAGDAGLTYNSGTDSLTVNGMIMAGSAALNVGEGQNLLYGNIDTGSVGNLLLLQTESADKFKVDKNGNTVIGGYIDVANEAVIGGELIAVGNLTVGGNLDLAGQITISGGAPGLNKVLTSDATGLATWQTPAGGLPAGTSGQTLRHNGTTWVGNSLLFNDGTNVGIGDASPLYLLTVGSGDLFGVNSTGRALAPLGTAALPAYTFTGDSDTGVYSSAANTLNFSTAGTSRVQINSTGKLGVTSLGTAALPAYTFTGDSDTGVYSSAANILNFSTAGINRMSIDASGNLTVAGTTLSGTDANNFYINGNADVQIRVDADNNGSNNFKINNGGNVTVFQVDESGNTNISGDLTVGGNDIKTSGGGSAIRFEAGNVIIRLGQ